MEPPLRPFQGMPISIHDDANGHHGVMAPGSSSTMQVDAQELASGKGRESHRGRYREKFGAMREKFDKAARSQEMYQKQLELANAKIKKLAAENELLLDALVQSDKELLDKYFPEENAGQIVGHPPWFERERDRERERQRNLNAEELLTARPLAPQHSNTGLGQNHHLHHAHVVHHHHHHPPPPPPLGHHHHHHHHDHGHGHGHNHHHHHHHHEHEHVHPEHRGHVHGPPQLPSLNTVVQPPPHIVPSHPSPYEEGPRERPGEYPGMLRVPGSLSGSGQSRSQSSSRRSRSAHHSHSQGPPAPIDNREREREMDRDRDREDLRLGAPERIRPPREGPPEPPILTSTYAEQQPPSMTVPMPPPPGVVFPPHQQIALPPPPPPHLAGYPPQHYHPGPPPPFHIHQNPQFDSPPLPPPTQQDMQTQLQVLPQPPLQAGSPPSTITPQGNGGSSFGRFHVVQRERRREDDPPPPPPPPANPNHIVDLGLNTFIPHGENGKAGVRGRARSKSKS